LLVAAVGVASATPKIVPVARMHQHVRPPKPETPKPEIATAKPPPQQFHGLMAQDRDAVRTRLGAPDVARDEGSGAMWTYRLPDCALFIFFRAPRGGASDVAARVSGAASGPRVRGQRPLPVNECIAEAMNRQGSGAPGPL
jgi:hypothetical protein